MFKLRSLTTLCSLALALSTTAQTGALVPYQPSALEASATNSSYSGTENIDWQAAARYWKQAADSSRALLRRVMGTDASKEAQRASNNDVLDLPSATNKISSPQPPKYVFAPSGYQILKQYGPRDADLDDQDVLISAYKKYVGNLKKGDFPNYRVQTTFDAFDKSGESFETRSKLLGEALLPKYAGPDADLNDPETLDDAYIACLTDIYTKVDPSEVGEIKKAADTKFLSLARENPNKDDDAISSRYRRLNSQVLTTVGKHLLEQYVPEDADLNDYDVALEATKVLRARHTELSPLEKLAVEQVLEHASSVDNLINARRSFTSSNPQTFAIA